MADHRLAGAAGTPAGGGGAVLSPRRHHLCRLWRCAGRRAHHPLRHHPAHPLHPGMGEAVRGAGAAGQGAERLSARHLWAAGDPEGRQGSAGAGVAQSRLPAGDVRDRGAARRPYPYRRHRCGARGCGRLLCAGRQCAHAVRRLLHAGRPRDLHPPDAGAVPLAPGGAGRELSQRIAGDLAIGGAARGERRADHRAADAGAIQLRLLRAFVPGRRHGRGTGRGLRPVRARRHRLYAHHRRAEAGRRDLSPDRRRFHRPAGVPAGFGAGRARALWRLRRRQRQHRQRDGDRRGRRQGDLHLRPRLHALLSGRGADPEERRHLALPRSRRICATCSITWASWW